MSIADEINQLNSNLSSSYTSVNNKEGTLPANQCFDNLPDAIDTITEGGDLTTLNVTPTTSAQTITPSGDIDGYNLVNVAAVTSAIDNNIQPENIISGKTILNVNGSATVLKGETRSVSLTNKNGQTYTPSTGKNGITSITVTPNNQARTVNPSTSQQSLTVNSGYSGNGTITVNAVTSSIDSDIKATNIKSGVNILGVNGSVVELNGQTKTVSPTTSQQTITPDSPKNGLTSVTVNAVTSAIDSNISAGNIKDGVTILGVTGTFDPSPTINSLNVTPTTSAQTITASGGVDGYSPVNVSAVTSSIDPNIVPNKIRNGCVILGVEGTYGESIPGAISITYSTSGYLIKENFYLCGRNDYGQQGNGTKGTDILTFTKRAENVAQIVLTDSTTGYITTSGDFYLCGSNNAGQQGIGTSGYGTEVTTFRKVAENVAQISLGSNKSGYLTTSGDFYLCGSGYSGEQGNGASGSNANVTTFTKRAENVAQIVLGTSTTGYLTNSGDFYLCGAGFNGQQGSNSTSDVTTFTKRAENVAQICLATSTGYVTTSGDFYLCGHNNWGQQGTGDTTNVKTFRKIAENVAKIALSNSMSGYITTSGDFYLCGGNGAGSQGNGTSGSGTNVATFTKRAENVAQIFLTLSTSGYITTSGDFYLCGNNNYSQQGTGNTTNVTTFRKVAENVAQISLEYTSSGYLTTSNDSYLCGYNNWGQQGSGDTNNVTTFTKRN